jgi:threonylcarbamoyladenosine tRNA methylthiotransferase MtaB
MRASFFLCTFGCRCNQADSAEMRARLCAGALDEIHCARDADLIVINSCTVTQRADQQVRQAVRRYHRENPRARIVVTGCYAERDPEVLAALPGVALVLGNASRHQLAQGWRGDPMPEAKIIRRPLAEADEPLISGSAHGGGRTRPFLKLQDGCDARCTYCIVPSVRGPGRSAPPDNILAEIRRLVALGYQEIVLTGVHLGSYGRGLPEPIRLAELLKRILDIPGLGRLRLSSIEPMNFDRNIVKLAAGNRIFAPHFHIPLQSGSDRILASMRRPYQAARGLDLLRFIRELLPHAGLGTDVLIGFPGETDDDFKATYDLVQESPLTYLHVFPFSARQGTEAHALPGRVPDRIVRERCEMLRALSGARNLAFRQRFLGQILPALTLAKEENLGECIVLTENYIHARIAGAGALPNRLIKVRIDEVRPEGTRAFLSNRL